MSKPVLGREVDRVDFAHLSFSLVLRNSSALELHAAALWALPLWTVVSFTHAGTDFISKLHFPNYKNECKYLINKTVDINSFVNMMLKIIYPYMSMTSWKLFVLFHTRKFSGRQSWIKISAENEIALQNIK